MQKREQTIGTRLKQAAEQQRAADQERMRFEKLNEDLDTGRHAYFDEARREADAARKKLTAGARAEVESRRRDWLESLDREKDAFVSLVRQRAGRQIVSAAREAISRLADAELEEQTARALLKQLENLEHEDVDMIRNLARQDAGSSVASAFELSPVWRERISAAVRSMGLASPVFKTVPDLVCGIEIYLGGHKIGWSVQEYLMTLSDEIDGLATHDQN